MREREDEHTGKSGTGEPRIFVLDRHEDASGISGTGTVAQGVEFGDGTAALRWVSEHRSTAVYASMADLIAIHGHEGRTIVRYLHDPDLPPLADLLWLLRGSRLTLDAIATGREGKHHAEVQAQRIVDHLGHEVTDEPPHTLVEVERLREALRTAAAGLGVLIQGGCDQASNLRRLADFMEAEAAHFPGSSTGTQGADEG